MALLSHGSNAGCITRLSLKGDIDSSETDIVPYRQRIVGISTVQGLGERGPVQISTKGVLLKRLTPIVQELCESRGGRPGLSVLTSLVASVDVKLY